MPTHSWERGIAGPILKVLGVLQRKRRHKWKLFISGNLLLPEKQCTCFHFKHIICCCCCWVAKLSLTLCNPMDCSTQASLSFTVSQSFLKLMCTELVMPSNHLICYYPLLLLPSIFPSIRVFSNESALWIRWPKDLSFSFGISPSDEYLCWFPLGLIKKVTVNFRKVL